MGRYPIPRWENEIQGIGSGTVDSYILTPEELEQVRLKYGQPVPTKGKRPTKQIELGKSPESRLTRDQYLQKRLEGKSRQTICQEHDIVMSTLKTKLSKWGLNIPLKEKAALKAYKLQAETP